MIITVTMNPAIDKTIETDRLCPGALHRIRNVAWDAGGKGINVSKTIRANWGKRASPQAFWEEMPEKP